MRVLSPILFASLLLALLCVPAVLANGSISLSSTPDAASVLIVGYGLNTGADYSLTTPATQTNVPAGPYVAIASKTGYQTLVRLIFVQDQQVYALPFTLVPLPPVIPNGSMNIDSVPSGAQVRVYGQSPPAVLFNGTTPLVLSNSLVPGRYMVRITLAGYSEYMAVYNVSSNQTVVVNASLVPIAPPGGILRLGSTPTNAYVVARYANNQSIADSGYTPMIMALPAGAYQLNFSMPDYNDYLLNVTLAVNQGITLNASLMHTNGSLTVDSIPTGAQVRVYTNSPPSMLFNSTTPLVLTYRLAPGQYLVRINKAGYAEYMVQRTIGSNQTVVVNASLIPIAPPGGILRYYCNPNASVTVRDRSNNVVVDSGFTPFFSSLPAGDYSVNFTQPGYSDYVTNVTLAVNSGITLNATLSPLPSFGLLRFDSSPPSVGVVRYPNNTLAGLGSTPHTLNLPVGAYQVNFSRTGYYNYGALVQVSANSTTLVNATLVPISLTLGSLSVFSLPSASSVQIVDSNQSSYLNGTTPLMLESTVLPGSYGVHIERPGYSPYDTNVSISANHLTLVTATLVQLPS